MGTINLGFVSLKYRLYCDMEEIAIVARGCSPAARARGSSEGPGGVGAPAVPHGGSIPPIQIEAEVEDPETSENPTQSFEIHNIIRRRTQFLAVIIYILL